MQRPTTVSCTLYKVTTHTHTHTRCRLRKAINHGCCAAEEASKAVRSKARTAGMKDEQPFDTKGRNSNSAAQR